MNESLIHFLFFLSVNCYIMTFFPISLLFKESSIKFPSKNGIIILTNSTINEALKAYQNILILMHAPWCHHCKKMLPVLEQVAKSKIANNMNLTFAKIDVDHYASIAKKYNVKGFPTTILFKDGEKKEIYKGENDKDSIIEWLYKRLINETYLIESLSDINEYQNNGKFNYIYFGQNKNNINIYKNFSLSKNIKFGLCQNLEIIKNSKLEPETAVFYKPFDEPSYVITKNITKENLENIMEENRYPLIYKDIKELCFYSLNNLEPAFFFFRNSSDIKVNEYDETMKKMALKYKGKIKFSIGDINEPFVQKILNTSNINLNIENFPNALIYDFYKKFNKWKFRDFYENYNEMNLELFIQNWIEKKLIEYKSEDAPGQQEAGKVFKVVHKTFKKDVLNNKLNVFVKFCIPNNTLCKEIEPIYIDLASKLKINGNIRIAEYDLEKNYFDYIKIEHYPTLILFRAGLKEKNELVEYKGNMNNVNDLIYFVLTNQAFPILNEKKDNSMKEDL